MDLSQILDDEMAAANPIPVEEEVEASEHESVNDVAEPQEREEVVEQVEEVKEEQPDQEEMIVEEEANNPEESDDAEKNEVSPEQLKADLIQSFMAEPFTRSVKVGEKARLRNIKKLIREQLEMDKSCGLNIYHVKEQDGSLMPGETLIGDNSTLEECGLEKGGKVEIELFFNLSVYVVGKGSSYVT